MKDTIQTKLFTEDEVIHLIAEAGAQMVEEVADNEDTADTAGVILAIAIRLKTIAQDNIAKLYKKEAK